MKSINELIGLPTLEKSRVIGTCLVALMEAGHPDATEADVRHYIECDYLTAHEGTDGCIYVWYMDGDNNTGAARVEDGAAVTMQELAAQGIPGAEEGIAAEDTRKYLLTSDRATAQEYTEKHSDYLYRLVAVQRDGVYFLLYKPVCTPPINGAMIKSMVRRAYALDDKAAQVIRAMQAEAVL